MLGEALTQVPHSLVFLEPRLDRGQFNIKYSQEILLENMGLNLKDFVAGINEDDNWVEKFKSQVLPLLYEKVAQVGVKEVKLNKWRQYKQIFPDMKVIVTARDPRDIYLSILERIKAGRRKWTGEFSPELIASKLNKQFAVQKKNLHTMIVSKSDMRTCVPLEKYSSGLSSSLKVISRMLVMWVISCQAIPKGLMNIEVTAAGLTKVVFLNGRERLILTL